MTATPPRADLRTLATVAAHDVDCPGGARCHEDLTTDGRYGRYADAVLAAVLPAISDMLLAQRDRLAGKDRWSGRRSGLEEAAGIVRRLAAAAPPAGLSAPVPAENAPAVPEEADGQRAGQGRNPPRDDLDDPGIRAAIAEAAISCIGGDNIAWAEIRESVADVQPLIAELRKTRADRDRLAAQVAHCQRVVEAAKALVAAIAGATEEDDWDEEPFPTRIHELAAAVDALSDAGTDQTEDDHG